MKIESSGVAIFRVNETGQEINVNAKDLDWDTEGVGENSMGYEYAHFAECDVAGHTVRWELWEYPVGCQDGDQTNVPPTLTMLENIKFELVHEPCEDDPENS